MDLGMLKMFLSSEQINELEKTAKESAQRMMTAESALLESNMRLKSLETDILVMQDTVSQVLTLQTEIISMLKKDVKNAPGNSETN